MQRGTIRKRHGAWHLRYYVTELVNGSPVRRQVTKRLASVSDEFRTARDCWPEAAKILDPLNRGAGVPAGRMSQSQIFQIPTFCRTYSKNGNGQPTSFTKM